MAVATGKAKWAHLLTPTKEDPVFKQRYEIDLYVDEATNARLKSEGITPKVDKETKEEFFKFWSHYKRKDGTINPPIRIVDTRGNKIEEDPGNGSIVKVQYNPVEWKFANKVGIMGALMAVQVKTLVSRTKDEFDYDEDVSEEFDDDIPF
jgi:hypothetical protein